jgi:hypothetical protein
MTPQAAPLSPARLRQGAPAVERRRGPAAFRGSLERRLPDRALASETEGLLPPVGRSEAFAEDLLDEVAGAAGGDTRSPRRPGLRWLGLPGLALGLGATLSLGDMTHLIGF